MIDQREFDRLADAVRVATAREIASGAAIEAAHKDHQSAVASAKKARDAFFAFVSGAAGFLDGRLR